MSVHQRLRASARERVEALREQVAVLVEAGVDLLILETFGYLDEFVEAAEVATAAGSVPVIAQATFGGDARTLSGHTPAEVVAALAGLPVVTLGTNCVLGPQRSLQILRKLREHTDLPLTTQPNAGLPRRVSPARFEYDIDAEYFVRHVRRLVDAGAAMVGGCCGTTPTQLAAVVEAVEEHRQRHRSPISAPRRTPASGGEPRTAPAPGTGPSGTDGMVVVELAAAMPDGLEATVTMATELAALGTDLLMVAPARGVRVHLNAVDLAVHLHQRLGLDTVAGVTTWDRTSMALQADLLGAHALGVRRIVCETGTPPLRGDYPHVEGIWDLDSIGLVELLSRLNDGVDCHGLRLPEKTEFEVGARINPGSHAPEEERARALAKIDAGARFLVTRPVYELHGLERLLDAIDGRVPVLATVAPLLGYERADYLAHEVPDVIIPADVLDALRRAGNAEAQARTGLELAARILADVRPLVSGVVIAPRTDVVSCVRALLGPP